MDIEPFYYIFISSSNGSLHRFFHTFLGASIIAVFTAFLLAILRKKIDPLMKKIKLGQPNLKNGWTYLTSFIAAYSHILFDAIMHEDVKPFWPITNFNPFLSIMSLGSLHIILALSFIAFLIGYFLTLNKK
jgi:membrane-bound metal-dependent hydrolase YbcI (DUF457 family)